MVKTDGFVYSISSIGSICFIGSRNYEFRNLEIMWGQRDIRAIWIKDSFIGFRRTVLLVLLVLLEAISKKPKQYFSATKMNHSQEILYMVFFLPADPSSLSASDFALRATTDKSPRLAFGRQKTVGPAGGISQSAWGRAQGAGRISV